MWLEKISAVETKELLYDPTVVEKFMSDEVSSLSDQKINDTYSKNEIRQFQTFLLKISQEFDLNIELWTDGPHGIRWPETRLATKFFMQRMTKASINDYLFWNINITNPKKTNPKKTNKDILYKDPAIGILIDAVTKKLNTRVNDPSDEFGRIQKKVIAKISAKEIVYSSISIKQISSRNIVTWRSVLLLEKVYVDYEKLSSQIKKRKDLQDSLERRIAVIELSMKENNIYTRRNSMYEEYYLNQGLSRDQSQLKATVLMQREIQVEAMQECFHEDQWFIDMIQSDTAIKDLYTAFNKAYKAFNTLFVSQSDNTDIFLYKDSPLFNTHIYDTIVNTMDTVPDTWYHVSTTIPSLSSMTDEELDGSIQTLYQKLPLVQQKSLGESKRKEKETLLLDLNTQLTKQVNSQNNQINQMVYATQLAYVEYLFADGKSQWAGFDSTVMEYDTSSIVISNWIVENTIMYHGQEVSYTISWDKITLHYPNDTTPYTIPIISIDQLITSLPKEVWINDLSNHIDVWKEMKERCATKIFEGMEDKLSSIQYGKRSQYMKRFNTTALSEVITTLTHQKTIDWSHRNSGDLPVVLQWSLDTLHMLSHRSSNVLHRVVSFLSNKKTTTINQRISSNYSIIHYFNDIWLFDSLSESTVSDENLLAYFDTLEALLRSPDSSSFDKEHKELAVASSSIWVEDTPTQLQFDKEWLLVTPPSSTIH